MSSSVRLPRLKAARSSGFFFELRTTPAAATTTATVIFYVYIVYINDNDVILAIVLAVTATLVAISLMNGVAHADPFSWGYTPWPLHHFCSQYHDWYSKCSHDG